MDKKREAPAFYVGEGEDGSWVAIRESAEPIFCLFCSSQEEAIQLGSQTFEEYQELFLERKIRAVPKVERAQTSLPHAVLRGVQGYQLEVA